MKPHTERETPSKARGADGVHDFQGREMPLLVDDPAGQGPAG